MTATMSFRHLSSFFHQGMHKPRTWSRPCQNYRPTLQKRLFSEASDTSLVKGTNSLSLGTITRHGTGDGCINLSVGGTKFTTLRSTVNGCAVLGDHVARAELNKEIMLDGAIFIDRDSKHFGFILQYLRNRADGVQSSCSSTHQLKKTYDAAKTALVLPKDHKILQELYAEAVYYRLDDLASTLSSTNIFVKLMGIFVGNNPFSEASKFFARLRTTMLAVGTVGTVSLGAKQDLNWLLKPLGLAKEENVDPA
ncbi:hypothetical protein MPSEU_000275800 [Mayamaea pseudoterrestris]|nr:hypothetical protein MPSEU_000275800 [Mayamaea pseudoterrestris]